jgi:hypothetical protein
LVLDFPYIGEQQRGGIRASKVFTVSAFRDKKKTYKKLHSVRVLAKINHALCSKNEIDHACGHLKEKHQPTLALINPEPVEQFS